MSQDLLGFVRDDLPDPGAIADALATLGTAWSGRDGDPYRQGVWIDPRTRARCVIDLGDPPVERDEMHPPKRYAGWTDAGVALRIPLAGPHWHAVESYRLAEALAGLGITLLDTEDVHEHPDAEPAPFPFTRARALLSWETLREAQADGLRQPRLGRAASVVLWRWRKDAPVGAPGLAVVEDHRRPGTALLVAVVTDPAAAVLLPPVDALLLMDGTQPRAVPGEHLAHLGAEPGPAGGRRYADLRPLLTAADPADGRFRLLGDEDWRD